MSQVIRFMCTNLKWNGIPANLLFLYTETPSVGYHIWHFACILTILLWECQNIYKTLQVSLFRINLIHFVRFLYESCINKRFNVCTNTIFISTYTHTYTCSYVYIYAYKHIHTWNCIYIYIYIYVCTYIYIYIYMYAHVYIYIYIYMYTHMQHIHTYIHT